MTCNRAGEGQAVYVGTAGNRALYDTLAPWLLELAGVPAPFTNMNSRSPSAAEETCGYASCLNHSNQQQRVTACGHDLLTGKPLDGEVTLPPKGVLVLRQESL